MFIEIANTWTSNNMIAEISKNIAENKDTSNIGPNEVESLVMYVCLDEPY
jgi:hypothetical protein